MEGSLEFLYSLRNQGSKFGIERMASLCQKLGNPQSAFPTVHVAGTNGKGSVCAMLDSIYRSSGYKVGLFTSPHLIDLGERIRVNGENLSFDSIQQWVDFILPPSIRNQNRQPANLPSFFELMTAIAFLEFRQQKVDLAIIETGLGGRLDSTNVLDPELSIITSVGLDHCDMLGSEISDIAIEKAGIIKQKKPVLTGWLEKDAITEVVRTAKEKKAALYLMDDVKSRDFPDTNLAGVFQKRNAALAHRAAQLLNPVFPVDEKEITEGLNAVHLPGRWQKISYDPTIILDACHNGQGAEVSTELWDTLELEFDVWFAACGIDRARDVLVPLSKYKPKITFFELNQPRSCTESDYRQLSQEFSLSSKFATEKEIYELYRCIPIKSTLLVTGSIYLVGAVLQRNAGPNRHSGKNWQDHW